MSGEKLEVQVPGSVSGSVAAPSVADLMAPLEKELGRGTFRLILAQVAHQQFDQQGILPAEGDDVRAVLTAWADSMSQAGWGATSLVELDPVQRRARLVVSDAVELLPQRSLPQQERWGCPLLFGAAVWAFSKAFGGRCWANETVDGDCRRVEFSVFPCDTSVGAELQLLRHSVAQDAQQQTLAAIAQKTGELEQARELLRMRTRDLRQEIEERERAERVKDEVVTVVNHELRTPLTSVRGFAELIRERDLPRETQVRYARIMCAETERLTGLLNNFLDVQRLGSVVHSYEWEAVDVAALLRNVAEVFSCGSHQVVVTVAEVLPPIRADRQRLHQALTNLVANAIKFSPGAAAVFVAADLTPAGVEIGVRDEGIGIPEDKIQHLFKMFYRVDNAATRSIGGTGLGLCLVQKIVEGHGGKVTVASVLGKGTTFRVTLPRLPPA